MEGDCNVYAHSSLWMRPTRPDRLYNAKMVYWSIHGEGENNHYNLPSISAIVRHANELWFSPNFPRLCWLSAKLQTCQLPTFGRTVPLFEFAKIKKRDCFMHLNISVMANFIVWKNRKWCQFYMGIVTSAFSPVYCDKFSYEKPSLNPKNPEPQLCGLFWFMVM